MPEAARIALFEDDPDHLNTIPRILELKGHEVAMIATTLQEL